MPESTHLLCAVCSDPVDPDWAHWPHEPQCGKSHGTAPADALCGCDRVAHPDCCPELECQDIGNGHTVELTARFSLPPWFTTAQANELARSVCEHVAATGRPLHRGFGPTAEDAYDIAYISAAQAMTQVTDGERFATPLVVWGHGDRCRSCHHVDDEHALNNTEQCAVKGCGCPRWMPYGRLAEIGEAGS